MNKQENIIQKDPAGKFKTPHKLWTEEEHNRFLLGINSHGFKNLRAISTDIGTRNLVQTRAYMRRFRQKQIRTTKRLRLGLSCNDGKGTSYDIEHALNEHEKNNFSIPLKYPSFMGQEEFLSSQEHEDMKASTTVPESCGLLLLSVVSCSSQRLTEDDVAPSGDKEYSDMEIDNSNEK